MAAELVSAAERAGYDLAELARRVAELAELRGLEGPDRPIPEGEAGARLAPGQRAAVLALAHLAEHLAAELGGAPPPAPVAATAGELRRLLLPLPAGAPVLATRADGATVRADLLVARQLQNARWLVVEPGEVQRGRALLVALRG